MEQTTHNSITSVRKLGQLDSTYLVDPSCAGGRAWFVNFQ
jgi:hypothetical protein